RDAFKRQSSLFRLGPDVCSKDFDTYRRPLVFATELIEKLRPLTLLNFFGLHCSPSFELTKPQVVITLFANSPAPVCSHVKNRIALLRQTPFAVHGPNVWARC